MDTYLAIMVTVLVLTQIIRVTQNAMQLRRLSRRIGTSTDAEVLAQWDRLVQSIDKLADIVDREGE